MARQRSALVVQDHEALGSVMNEVLRAEGYDVLTVADVDSAIAEAGEQDLDLVVCDIRWQPGTPDPLRDLLESDPELALILVRDEPVVAVPFFGPWRVEGRLLTLRRPFRLHDLVEAVREMMRDQNNA